MAKVKVDFTKIVGRIKPMHAVNNGPVNKGGDQIRSNFKSFQAAGIPYVRNHDASFWAAYGGEHTVDVHAIFPDFDADPLDPASYDFTLTDRYTELILTTGAEVFYRLGSKIEHWPKKYGVIPPKDFQKWAVICEHIIAHYNEGWADGFHWNIRYWEIWNEANMKQDTTWVGTDEAFFEFYATAALHLKKRFPELKIGGPALAYGFGDYLERFLAYMVEKKVEIDFLSWHLYMISTQEMLSYDKEIRETLDKYGYKDTESILDEWNYVKDWKEGFVDTLKVITGVKGSAFTSACMLAAQNSSIDMLMYYDCRPCAFNGMYDFITLEPYKGYYPFLMFHDLYQAGSQVEAFSDDPNVYVVGAVDEEGKPYVMISYYHDECVASNQVLFELTGTEKCNFDCYVLDENTDCKHTISISGDGGSLILKPFTTVLLK